METTKEYRKSMSTTLRLEKMGRGVLRIHSAFCDGKLVGEAFTLESLAHVLDMPMSTMDGRYARGKLAKWNVPIINGYGRPARGFPLPLLDDVIAIITTKGACVGHDVNGSGPANIKPQRLQTDLVPEFFGGKSYYTIPAIAAAFGYSETTIRKKLERAGLMGKFQNLSSPVFGGRPKRGIAAMYLPDLKLAIAEGVAFMGSMERVLNSARYEQAKVDMAASVAPHDHIPAGSLRAYDRETTAPVNGVNPIDDVTVDLMGQLEQMMAGVTLPELQMAPPPAPEGETPDQELARRMWDMQMHALVRELEEPTKQELADTVDMLGLDKAAGERFVAEVLAKRAEK